MVEIISKRDGRVGRTCSEAAYRAKPQCNHESCRSPQPAPLLRIQRSRSWRLRPKDLSFNRRRPRAFAAARAEAELGYFNGR